jgi:hypothetical protein
MIMTEDFEFGFHPWVLDRPMDTGQNSQFRRRFSHAILVDDEKVWDHCRRRVLLYSPSQFLNPKWITEVTGNNCEASFHVLTLARDGCARSLESYGSHSDIDGVHMMKAHLC